MAVCEFLGGPRDGEKFSVPGSLPPETITVLAMPGALTMWHPAIGEVPIVVCHLTNEGGVGTAWKYRWPVSRANA